MYSLLKKLEGRCPARGGEQRGLVKAKVLEEDWKECSSRWLVRAALQKSRNGVASMDGKSILVVS